MIHCKHCGWDNPDYLKRCEKCDSFLTDEETFDEARLREEASRSNFKHYFSFDGRIGRLEYFLSYVLVTVYAYLADLFPEGTDELSADMWALLLMWLLLLIPMLWMLLAQGAKRCHDIGVSGWFQLIPLFYLWLFVAKGDAESNKYGQPI